ncbi:MAG: hypothetical protein KC496_00990 [Anaerolineae bacterium]|nr:hypothetical protein [Anaerolineae bacterium]
MFDKSPFASRIKQDKQFRLGRKAEVLRPKERAIRAEKITNPEDEPPFYVRGMKADSKDEYWVSLALEKIEQSTGWTWEYQVPVFGGRDRAGGNVIDFIVHTPGMWTILDPMGSPWHTGAREDRYQMENVARRKNWILIAWFTDQTPTRESVYQYLKNQLHV